MRHVYFDSAATTKMRDEVIDLMAEVMRDAYGNPSSSHAYGRKSKSLVENARKNIAKLLNVPAKEIIFTSGGTEADNHALKSAVRDLGVKRIITSPIEHKAILHTVEELKEKHGTEIVYVRLLDKGYVDFDHLEELLSGSDKKTLVSLMMVNNEVANILDMKRTGELCKKYNAFFHSDTVQAMGHFEMDFSDIHIDFAAASAHKFHGPKGVGFAFIREASGMRPLIFGANQERGLRAGTEAVHNIVGMEKAFAMAMENLAAEKAYITELKSYFIEELKRNIPGVYFNGGSEDLKNSSYIILNVNLPIDAEKAKMVLFQLDLKGVACSKGSACQSGADSGSHVLNTINSPEDLKHPSLRFSLSMYNTKDEVDYAINALKELVNETKVSSESVG